MRATLAAAFLLVSQTAPPGLLYDFEWRSSAMLSRWEAGDTVTSRGELAGKGRLRLTRLRDGRWHFAFWSPAGQGEGDILDDRLQSVTFPVPLDVGRPAPPPHLTTGTFKAIGDPLRPAAFELVWADGFICRTMPATWATSPRGRAS